MILIKFPAGHLDIVKFLLENGANPNQKALCGATALHFSAECGHLDIVKELLKHGAEMARNEHGTYRTFACLEVLKIFYTVLTSVGLTPLLAGAERTRLGIVEYLIKQDSISFEDKIDALELLGASFANDKDSYSLELAYVFMRRGMECRYVFKSILSFTYIFYSYVGVGRD